MGTAAARHPPNQCLAREEGSHGGGLPNTVASLFNCVLAPGSPRASLHPLPCKPGGHVLAYTPLQAGGTQLWVGGTPSGAARGGDNHSKLVSGTLALRGQGRDLLPLAPHLGKGRGRGGQEGSPRPHGAGGGDDEAGGRLGARERAQHQQHGTALPVFTRFQWDGTSWGEGRHSRGGTRCGPPRSNCPSADQRPASRLSAVTPGRVTSPHAAEGCWLRFGKP